MVQKIWHGITHCPVDSTEKPCYTIRKSQLLRSRSIMSERSSSSIPFTETNADTFHIDDAEITLLTDSGTRIVTHRLSTDMLPLHIHPHYELFFIEQGTLRVLFENEEKLLKANDLIIIPPNVAHLTLLTDESSHRINLKFHIQKNAINPDVSFWNILNTAFLHPYVLLQNHTHFKETLKNLYQSLLRQDRLYESFYFHEFLVRFLHVAPALANKAPAKPLRLESDIMRYHTVSSIINGEFNSNISLEAIAKVLNLSVRQTSRVVQECYGVPFSQLILENKMRYAAKLLEDSSLSVAEISKQTGYASVKGFYHSFKKRFQMLPTEYRERHSKKSH